MRFATICSGSSGNCIYINGGRTHVLVDGGCSLKALRIALAQLGIEETMLDAILITHEHVDHVKGVARIAKRFGIPVYASERTWENLPFREDFLQWERHRFDYGMEIGDLGLDFFRLSHDAIQPVGLVFDYLGQRVGVATDTGVLTPSMQRLLGNIDGIVFEANHCTEMLRRGPYPYYLKQRILSDRGHLSNVQAGAALQGLLGPRSQAVVLAHLSHVNNAPQLAYEQVLSQLEECPHLSHVRITVAPRYVPHPLIYLEPND